jgi:hypothetical protein
MIRIGLVALVVVVFALALVGMWLGWNHRGQRQAALLELPTVPEQLGPSSTDLAPELTGLYLGSTTATHWQDRIVARGLGARADSVARLTAAGALIERVGTGPIFIPAEQLIDARLEPALAGKVVGPGGVLVLRWRHGDADLDTGIRADDKSGYPQWVRAVERLGHSQGVGQ